MNASFRLRPALAQDAAVIRRLVLGAQLNPFGLYWPRFVVAEDQQGQVIGCAQVKLHGDVSELASLVIEAEWRSRGVARALIEHWLAASDPAGGLYLMCRSGLGPFYQRFGFVALRPAQMPAYFRRIHTLFQGLKRLAFSRENLLVMHRPRPEPFEVQ